MKSFNAFWLISHTSFNFRLWLTCGAFLAGYVCLAASVFVGFWFAIASIVLIGAACSLGESVLLGFLKASPRAVRG